MLERYIISGAKRLRCGYTTGSCAAAAAKAAAIALLSGKAPERVTIDTPASVRLDLAVEDAAFGAGWASCAVRKDAGDDIDATDGILVYARVALADGNKITVDGGEGVGRVTRKGLDQPVGAAAINRVPRAMIAREVRAVLDESGRESAGAFVVIFVPQGEAAAAKTYNPRLGIVGGISVLGTTGIVEPMSEAAMVDSIRVELDMLKAAGDEPILITPGSYGETFSRETLQLPLGRSVLCSNFLGETLDYAAQLGFAGILLVGHIGKLIKLAGGIYQTHSHVADGRMEILTAHAALAGAGPKTAKALMGCVTTDAALDILEEEHLLDRVVETVLEKLSFHLKARTGQLFAGAVLFSNSRGVLGQTPEAAELLRLLQQTEETR